MIPGGLHVGDGTGRAGTRAVSHAAAVPPGDSSGVLGTSIRQHVLHEKSVFGSGCRILPLAQTRKESRGTVLEVWWEIPVCHYSIECLELLRRKSHRRGQFDFPVLEASLILFC